MSSVAFLEARSRQRKFATEELVALMALGITQTEAARRLGVSQTAVANRLVAEGLTWPSHRRVVDRETFTRLWKCHTISTEEIAQWLGVTRQAVSDRARRMGLPSRAKVRRRIIRLEELKDLWKAGVATKDIAAYFGLAHHSCVSTAARNAGLPPRQRGVGKGAGLWIGTISMREYRELKLAERMMRAIGKGGQ